MDNKVKTTGANLTPAEIKIVRELAEAEAQMTGTYNFSAALRKIIRQWHDQSTAREARDDGTKDA